VKRDIRALLLHLGDREYLLVGVEHRSDVYDDLTRYAYLINRVTGGIEVMDLKPVDTRPVGDSIIGRVLPAEPKPELLFASWSDAQLVQLGVSEPLLSEIRRMTTVDELMELLDRAPQLTTVMISPAVFRGRSRTGSTTSVRTTDSSRSASITTRLLSRSTRSGPGGTPSGGTVIYVAAGCCSPRTAAAPTATGYGRSRSRSPRSQRRADCRSRSVISRPAPRNVAVASVTSHTFPYSHGDERGEVGRVMFGEKRRGKTRRRSDMRPVYRADPSPNC
jgi:hypothetical protein